MEENREKTAVYREKVLSRLSILVLLVGMLCLSPTISASNALFEQKYSLNLSFKNARLEQVLDAIMEQSGVRIAYSNEELQEDKMVSVNIRTTDILVALRTVLGDGYAFKQIDDYIAIAKEKTSDTSEVIVSSAAGDIRYIGCF